MAKSLLDPKGPYGNPGAVALTKPRQGIGSTIGGGSTTSYKPPTSSPIGSGITSPGGSTGGSSDQTVTTTYTPNQVYQGDILSDPQAVGAQGIFDAQTSGLAAARASAIQRAIINSGWTPQMSGALAGYGGDVTGDTLASAAANPMSEKAQLDLQLNQANQNLPYDLAATGAGRSGANAIQQGALQRQYQTAAYQGQQNLLNSIYGAANTYAGSYNDAMNQLMNARANVANRLAQTAGYSQSITSSGGGGGYDTGGGGDTSPFAPDYSDPNLPAPYGTYIPPPNPTIQAVQRAISSIGGKSNPRAYQTLRNVMAG